MANHPDQCAPALRDFQNAMDGDHLEQAWWHLLGSPGLLVRSHAASVRALVDRAALAALLHGWPGLERVAAAGWNPVFYHGPRKTSLLVDVVSAHRARGYGCPNLARLDEVCKRALALGAPVNAPDADCVIEGLATAAGILCRDICSSLPGCRRWPHAASQCLTAWTTLLDAGASGRPGNCHEHHGLAATFLQSFWSQAYMKGKIALETPEQAALRRDAFEALLARAPVQEHMRIIDFMAASARSCSTSMAMTAAWGEVAHWVVQRQHAQGLARPMRDAHMALIKRMPRVFDKVASLLTAHDMRQAAHIGTMQTSVPAVPGARQTVL